MKKDIEWLKKEIGAEMIRLEPNRKERWSDVKYQTLRSVAQKIDQLDEPEVLSEEWVDSNSVNASHDGVTEEYVHVIDLKNLIIPKQESEVTLNRAFEKVSETYPMTKEEVYRHLEKFVAHGGRVTYGEPEVLSKEWVNNNVVHVRGLGDIFEEDTVENLLIPKQEELEVKIQELIEAYKQEEDAYSNPENGWISGFIEDLKNLVEEEQRYYILDFYDIPLLERVGNQIQKTTTELSIHEKARDISRFELTEQEIKSYDERFWAFAEPVEQADFRLSF